MKNMLDKMHTPSISNVEVDPNSFFVTNTTKTKQPEDEVKLEKINPASGRVSTQKNIPEAVNQIFKHNQADEQRPAQ